MMHMNLTTSNVLVDSQGVIKISDYIEFNSLTKFNSKTIFDVKTKFKSGKLYIFKIII